MSSHVFHEIYLHFNWHTKDDLPLLTSDLEPLVHDYLRQRCRQTKGVYFHGIGGTVRDIGGSLLVAFAGQYQLSRFRVVLVKKQFYNFLTPKACRIHEGDNRRVACACIRVAV